LVLLGLLTAVVATGCSEASMRGQRNFGVKQLFVSQAGLCNNKVLISTGKIDSSTSSDGWSMIDAKTDKLVRVAGDAVIVDATQEQISVYTGAGSLKEAEEKLNKLIQEDGTILKQPAACVSVK
jgi:hypothetical protein